MAACRSTGLTDCESPIMPNVPSGDTMAPCVVIGERAAEILKRAHKI
jgi:choline dehydrogenase